MLKSEISHPSKSIPLVSIALCTYKGEDFLREQLDSIVGQTYSNIEVIAVDDNSNDASLAILQSYAGGYPFIHVYTNSQTLGLTKNFEKAISLCKGEYIAISDQDDSWELNKIETLVNAIEDNLLVYAVSEMVDATGLTLHKTSIDRKQPYSGSDLRTALLINCAWGHNILFHKKLTSLALPLPCSIDYDWMLTITALNYGKIKYVDKILVRHRLHNTNVTRPENKTKHGVKFRLRELHSRIAPLLTFNDLQHREFIEKIYLYSKPEGSVYHRWKLAVLLFRNRKILYSTSSKNIFSILNNIRLYLF